MAVGHGAAPRGGEGVVKASGRRDRDDCSLLWGHDFPRITVICVLLKYSMPNLIFHHEDKVARQAGYSPQRDSNYTHLRFPGASTKRTIHDVLPSRVYKKMIRSNTLAGHENMDKRSENVGRRSKIIMKSTGWTAPTEPSRIGICKLYFLSADVAFRYKNQWASICSQEL